MDNNLQAYDQGKKNAQGNVCRSMKTAQSTLTFRKHIYTNFTRCKDIQNMGVIRALQDQIC